MRYAIVNLTREEVDFLHQLMRDLDEIVPVNVDLENLLMQTGAPAAQDEPMGEIWAAAIFEEDEDGG